MNNDMMMNMPACCADLFFFPSSLRRLGGGEQILSLGYNALNFLNPNLKNAVSKLTGNRKETT